jgi:hypothetical protein
MADPISVFVRVRPLTPQEVDAGTGTVPGIATQTKFGDDAVAMHTDNALIDGFSGVIGTSAKNVDVFEKCFADRIPVVTRGGFASAFGYGYTGGGKTHTMIGYGEEKGIYRLATERLLSEISDMEGLFLNATACEVYDDKVFDLLGEEKLECSLKVDAEGELQVLGPADTSDDLTCEEKGQFSKEDFPQHLRQLLVPVDSIKLSNEHYLMFTNGTLMHRTKGLRALVIRKAEDLDAVSKSCVQKRASGDSTEHTQSSRSHAVLKVEVVSQKLLDARAKATSARACVHPALSAADNAGKFCLSQIADIKAQTQDHSAGKFTFTLREKGVAEALKKDDSLVQWYSTFGWWKIVSRTTAPVPPTAPTEEVEAETETGVGAGAEAEEVAPGTIEMIKYALEVNGKCDGIERTLEEWQTALKPDWDRMQAEEAEIQRQLALIDSAGANDTPPILPFILPVVPPVKSPGDSKFELVVGSESAALMPYLRDFGPDFKSKLHARELQADIMRKQARLKARADVLEAEAQLAEAEVASILEAGQPALGGALLFVDLAGADYDHRNGQRNQQQRESIAINKSLLALKECLRSLVQNHRNQGAKKAPFRGAKITRLLEDALAPSGKSKRRNKESVSLMLVNVSPNAQLEKMTLNSLRYGQMYADGSTDKGKYPTRVRQEVASGKGAGKGRGGFAAMDPDEAKVVLMEIYKTWCPEKTEEDVDTLLAKFVGRERTLIQKVRKKYGA